MLLVLKLFTSAWSQIIPSQFCHRRDIASIKYPKSVWSLLEERDRSLGDLSLQLSHHLRTLPCTANCKARLGQMLMKGSLKPRELHRRAPFPGKLLGNTSRQKTRDSQWDKFTVITVSDSGWPGECIFPFPGKEDGGQSLRDWLCAYSPQLLVLWVRLVSCLDSVGEIIVKYILFLKEL